MIGTPAAERGARGFAAIAGAAGLAVALVACAGGGKPAGDLLASWMPPADSQIPNDSLGASIRRGLALVTNTVDSLPTHAPGNINCTSCHLNAGRNPDASPLTGAHARYPKYMDRSGAVVGMADRVNYCFTRSLAGTRLPTDSREMQDILAYITWLSLGVPVGDGHKLAGANGTPALSISGPGDNARGELVYAAKCAACHMPDGQGVATVRPRTPALWGPKSFSVGASMARQSRAAAFIWHNMPLGLGKTLTQQEAFDVAAYITSKPRPDSPGKEGDWPGGGAPGDVPYATKGRAAYLPPPVLPRANAAATLVPAPRSVRRK